MAGKYLRKRSKKPFYLGLLAVVLVVAVAVGLALWDREPDPSLSTQPSGTQNTAASTEQSQSTASTTVPTTAPTEPPITKLSSASLANMGDMLMHLAVIRSGYSSATGEYDYADNFAYIRDHITAADYAVANLETTLAGLDAGYKYSGYPCFNCPDAIAKSLMEAGFDMLLTANNHSYDTGTTGFHRTQQVLSQLGLDYLGTVEEAETPLWQVREIDGVNIGMVCYTYQTGDLNNVSLNGIPMRNGDGSLIGTFSYSYLDAFYTQMEENIQAMEDAGAEAVVLYIHWGDEYQLVENSYQNQIAQKMCDLGVDVIVGGHAHVVQPIELLTATDDPGHQTVCLYSMGNAISNQRKEAMGAGYPQNTEDGLIFSFSFAKYSDGTVILESVDAVPTWVNHYYNSAAGRYAYEILPLDKSIEDWQTQFQLTDAGLADCDASYERTMKIIGEGLQQVQEYVEQLVVDTETRLGVQ